LEDKKYTNERESVPLTSLLNCRTVVERKDYVSTGVLTYAEGDLLEVEIAEYQDFELGESVKITIYSPVGIHILQSSVIAKYEGAILIIHPPNHQSKFEDKRKYPRIATNKGGHILKIVRHEDLFVLDEPLSFNLSNISLEGIGFILPKTELFSIHTKFHGELDLGYRFPCIFMIVRKQVSEEGIFYGAELLEVSEEYERNLRAFILKQQIENHYEMMKSKIKTAQ